MTMIFVQNMLMLALMLASLYFGRMCCLILFNQFKKRKTVISDKSDNLSPSKKLSTSSMLYVFVANLIVSVTLKFGNFGIHELSTVIMQNVLNCMIVLSTLAVGLLLFFGAHKSK